MYTQKAFDTLSDESRKQYEKAMKLWQLDIVDKAKHKNEFKPLQVCIEYFYDVYADDCLLTVLLNNSPESDAYIMQAVIAWTMDNDGELPVEEYLQ